MECCGKYRCLEHALQNRLKFHQHEDPSYDTTKRLCQSIAVDIRVSIAKTRKEQVMHCPIHGERRSDQEREQGVCLQRIPALVCAKCYAHVNDGDLVVDTLIHADCGGHCERRAVFCDHDLVS